MTIRFKDFLISEILATPQKNGFGPAFVLGTQSGTDIVEWVANKCFTNLHLWFWCIVSNMIVPKQGYPISFRVGEFYWKCFDGTFTSWLTWFPMTSGLESRPGMVGMLAKDSIKVLKKNKVFCPKEVGT